MMNFKVIDCESYVYIKEETKYSYNDLSNYRFDGQQPIKTNRQDWFKIDKIPTVVTKKGCTEYINRHYELKSMFTANDMLPQTLDYDEVRLHEDDGKYEDILGCYEHKYDVIEPKWEPIEFEIEVVYKKKDMEFIPRPVNFTSNLLDEIEYDPAVLQDKPCQIDSAGMYEIIRKYVKEHIDTNTAKISSDYDFHFEVQRIVGLANPYTQKYDANGLNSRKKKPNWVERTVKNKTVSILNLKRKSSDSNYGDTHLAPAMSGSSFEDLQSKINAYCENLMNEINKKYCECPQCQGWGVIEI